MAKGAREAVSVHPLNGGRIIITAVFAKVSRILGAQRSRATAVLWLCVAYLIVLLGLAGLQPDNYVGDEGEHLGGPPARAPPAAVASPTDSCRDRLAAFYHWDDRQSLEVAIQIARRQRVNQALIRRWSDEEGFAEMYQEFLTYMRRKKRQ